MDNVTESWNNMIEEEIKRETKDLEEITVLNGRTGSDVRRRNKTRIRPRSLDSSLKYQSGSEGGSVKSSSSSLEKKVLSAKVLLSCQKHTRSQSSDSITTRASSLSSHSA